LTTATAVFPTADIFCTDHQRHRDPEPLRRARRTRAGQHEIGVGPLDPGIALDRQGKGAVRVNSGRIVFMRPTPDQTAP
jgi:hypothetical protein